MSERDEIMEILSSVGICGEELEWMTNSCPSVAHAIEESDRRMGKIEPTYTEPPEEMSTAARALTVHCRKCGSQRGRQCAGLDIGETHVLRVRDSLEV